MMNKEEAVTLLKQHVKQPENLRHNLEVGAGMKALALHFSPTDTDLWEVVGILHDLDIEWYNDDSLQHIIVGGKLLEEAGIPADIIHSIQTHNEALGKERKTVMEHCLYSCDGLTGLIHAYVLMRPDKDIANAKVKSIMKKIKDKSFARGVPREEILCVPETLNMEVREFVTIVLDGMQKYM
jgi:predicted hydrolase (HD superfamily)